MVKANRSVVVLCPMLLMVANVSLAQQSAIPQGSVPALKVSSGDLLDVSMYDNPDLSGHYRVDEKGDIVVPLLGAVHVEGRTAAEIGRIVEKRYVEAEILPSDGDYATVFISEYATQGITVSGEVKEPGTFPALGVRMLHDVITAAGGVSPTASSRISITRKDDQDHPITIDYNPSALQPVIPQVQIFPGDSILVPRAGVVYVLGNVLRPGAYVLEGRSSLTVEEVLALAGNSGRAAEVKHTHLIRTQDGGRKVDVVLELNEILKGKAPDLAMKDGDILYIPTSNRKLATYQALTSAIAVGSSVAIYRTAYQ